MARVWILLCFMIGQKVNPPLLYETRPSLGGWRRDKEDNSTQRRKTQIIPESFIIYLYKPDSLQVVGEDSRRLTVIREEILLKTWIKPDDLS